jgi:hypothetical protein
MRESIFAYIEGGGAGLDPFALKAIERLRDRGQLNLDRPNVA